MILPLKYNTINPMYLAQYQFVLSQVIPNILEIIVLVIIIKYIR